MKKIRNFILLLLSLSMILLPAGCDLFPQIPLAGTINQYAFNYAWETTGDFIASNPVDNQYFGYSTAISENYAVVGAAGENGNTGAVYIFSRSGSGWSATPQRITSADAGSGFGFGYRVKIVDTAIRKSIIVTAINQTYTIGADSHTGAVYVYELVGSTWQIPAALTATTGKLTPPAPSYRFGENIAVTEDFIFVGERVTSSNPAGVAHVFLSSDFSWVWTFFEGSTSGYRFGDAFAVSKDYLFIAAPYSSASASAAGAVYMYKRDAGSPPWLYITVVENPSPEADQHFGTSLSLNGNFLAVGEPGNSASDPHRVFIFTVSGSTISYSQTVLNNSPGAETFGEGVAFSGNWLAIADDRYDDTGINEGAVFLYPFLLGTVITVNPTILNWSNPIDNDYFSSDIALLNNKLLVGASHIDTDNRGRAFIYEYLKQPK